MTLCYQRQTVLSLRTPQMVKCKRKTTVAMEAKKQNNKQTNQPNKQNQTTDPKKATIQVLKNQSLKTLKHCL